MKMKSEYQFLLDLSEIMTKKLNMITSNKELSNGELFSNLLIGYSEMGGLIFDRLYELTLSLPTPEDYIKNKN